MSRQLWATWKIRTIRCALNAEINLIKTTFMKYHLKYSCHLWLTNEVPKLLVVVGLFPVTRPADHHSVVLETSQTSNLNQVGRPISQIGGDDHLREALHLLCLHQLTQRLQTHKRVRAVIRDAAKTVIHCSHWKCVLHTQWGGGGEGASGAQIRVYVLKITGQTWSAFWASV